MKVLWTVDEIGLPFTRTDAGMQFGVVQSAEYKAMNPNSRVPTIDDDGFVLWESNTICRYLAAKHAPGKLIPTDLQGRADAERWMDWASFHLGNAITPLFWQLIRTPVEKRDAKTIDTSRAETEAAMRIVDAQLAGKAYITGAGFTVGDMPMGVMVHRWLQLPIERPALANVEAYYQRLMARPAYVKNVAHPLT
jgi:glutathione S-transferase